MAAADLLLQTLQLRWQGALNSLHEGWRRIAPRGLAALARYEGAELWLLRSLREKGCDGDAPAELVEALRQRARQISASNMLVDAETLRTIDSLQANGVPFVLLKGSARRALAATYPFGDARATVDVDVLLPHDVAEPEWRRLHAAGYRRVWEDQPSYHLAAIAGAGGVAVELHTALAPGMEPAEAWRRIAAGADEVAWNGRRVRVPNATELLWHSLTHALRAEGSLGWRFRHFLDAATLLASGNPVAWDTIRARLRAGEVAEPVARAWLVSAAQLAGVGLPEDVPEGALDFDLRRVVRWRLAVLARRDDAGLGARLLEEGTRCELGAPPAPRARDAAPWQNARRWLGGRAARVMYRWWRAREGRGEDV